MDRNLVFIKTTEGEEAVRQRARLVQRNLRNVLIMVDGYSTVGELAERFGDDAVVESSVSELERLGLIETFERRIVREMGRDSDSASPTSVEGAELPYTHETDTAEDPDISFPAIEPGAVERAIEQTPERVQCVEALFAKPVTARGEDVEFDEPPPITEEPHAWADTKYDETATLEPLDLRPVEPVAEYQIPKFPPPPKRKLPPPPKPSIGERLSGVMKAFRVRHERTVTPRQEPQAAPEVTEQSKPVEVSIPIVEVPSEAPASKKEKPVKIKPIRKDKKPFPWGSVLVAVVAGGLLAAAVGVMVYPYDQIRVELEQNVSRRMGEEVHIKRAGFGISPVPGLRLEGVTIGQKAWAQAAVIHLVPDWLSLFSDFKVIRELQIERASLPAAVLPSFFATLGNVGESNQMIGVRSLTFANSEISIGDDVVSNLSGNAVFAASGALEHITIKGLDNTLAVTVTPGEKRHKIQMSGTKFKIPGMPYVFNSLQVDGEMDGISLSLRQLEGRLYDGLISGTMTIDWVNDISLKGDLFLRNLELINFLPSLAPGIKVEGKADIKLLVSGQTRQLSSLGQTLHYEGNFNAQRGRLNVDLAEAVRRVGDTPILGGETRYDNLQGDFRCERGNCTLRNVKLDAGALRANGGLASRASELNGSLNVEIRSAARVIRAPVTISGSLESPGAAASVLTR